AGSLFPDLGPSGEHTHGQWTPRDQSDPEVLQGRDQFLFDGAVGEVVDALFRNKSKGISLVSGHLCGSDVPTSIVGRTDVGDFAFLDQLLHGLPDLVKRSRSVD